MLLALRMHRMTSQAPAGSGRIAFVAQLATVLSEPWARRSAIAMVRNVVDSVNDPVMCSAVPNTYAVVPVVVIGIYLLLARRLGAFEAL